MEDQRLTKKRPSAVGKTSERARCVQLMNQGLNNLEICRQFGLNRKTGRRWRLG